MPGMNYYWLQNDIEPFSAADITMSIIMIVAMIITWIITWYLLKFMDNDNLHD